MPTYEYTCEKCGVFEHFHSINDKLTSCPACGSEVNRLISRNTNIIFKGSGFHVTDYRSGDYKKKADNESGNSGSNSTGSTASSNNSSGAAASASTTASSPKNDSKAS